MSRLIVLIMGRPGAVPTCHLPASPFINTLSPHHQFFRLSARAKGI